MASESGLCCCEYINVEGDRSHVLAVCCDCQFVDETFERCITCKSLPPNMLSRICSILSDRCRIPWCDGKGARQIQISIFLPIILVPSIFIIAAQGWLWTIAAFLILLILLMLTHVHFYVHKIRTQFFLSWTVSSLVFLLGVFELEVVPYLEILFIENFILMCFVAIMCVCGYFLRNNPGILEKEKLLKDYDMTYNNATLISMEEVSKCTVCNIVQPPRSSHCRFCDHCVMRRDHHCIWLDSCIGARNHRLFIIGLLALFAACLYGSLLTLTTICHPFLVFELFLLPDNCSEVYEDIYIAISYVSALYALIISCLALMALLQQGYLICRNTTMQEFRRNRGGFYSRGIFRNCYEFWCGLS